MKIDANGLLEYTKIYIILSRNALKKVKAFEHSILHDFEIIDSLHVCTLRFLSSDFAHFLMTMRECYNFNSVSTRSENIFNSFR